MGLSTTAKNFCLASFLCLSLFLTCSTNARTLVVNDYLGYEIYKQTIGDPFCGEDTLIDRWTSICIGALVDCDVFNAGAEVDITFLPPGSSGQTRCENPNSDSNFTIDVYPRNGPTFDVLQGYDSVFWVCGDASQNAATSANWTSTTEFWAGPGREDRDALDAWLALGGKTLVFDCQEFVFDWVDQPTTLGLVLDVDTNQWILDTFGIGLVVDRFTGKSNQEVIDTRLTNWYTADVEDINITFLPENGQGPLGNIEVCVDPLGISSVRKMFNLPDEATLLEPGVQRLWYGQRNIINESGLIVCEPTLTNKTDNITLMTYYVGPNVGCAEGSVAVGGECLLCANNGTTVNGTCTSSTEPGVVAALDQRLFVGFLWEWTARSSQLGAYLEPFLPNTYTPPPENDGDGGGDDPALTGGVIGGSIGAGLLLLCCVLCCCACIVILVVACLAGTFAGMVGFQVYQIKNADGDEGDELGADLL